MQSCYHTCVHSDHVGVAFLVSKVCIVRTVSVVGLPRLCHKASLAPSPRCRVWYRLIQSVKIMTVRFGENLHIGVRRGEGTLDCEKMTRISIHEIFRYNKNQQISIP